MPRHGVLAAVLLALVVASPIAEARPNRGGDLLWKDQFSDTDSISNAVAVAGGRLVLVATVSNAAGNRDISVRAYNAKSGEPLWSDLVNRQGADDFGAAIVLDTRTAIVTGRSIVGGSVRAILRAYDAKTGAVLWEDAWPGTAGALALHGGLVLVSGNVVDGAGTSRPLVRAYRTTSGAIVWEDTTHASGLITTHGRTGFVTTAVPSASFPLAAFSCLVRAFDVATGGPLWETIQDVASDCSPISLATDGRHVVVAGAAGLCGDDLFARGYDAATGDTLWTVNGSQPCAMLNAYVAVDIEKRRAFFAGFQLAIDPVSLTLCEQFLVQSYDVRTGSLQWEAREPEQCGEVPTASFRALDLVAKHGRLYVVGGGSTDSLVRAYDTDRGALLWRDDFQMPGPVGCCFFPPRQIDAEGGRVFVAAPGMIRAYDAK
jgi:outer membrane protein assembly factor BamB